MFTLNSFADVLNVAKTFGVEALNYAVRHCTIDIDSIKVWRECCKYANRTSIEVTNFNDGNVEYTITANFTREMMGGDYYTTLADIRFIRTGFGAYDLTATEAMNSGEITKDILTCVLNEIKEHNEAARILGY